MLSVRTLSVTLMLATVVASAQTPPPINNGGRPFGGRNGSGNSGPFTPGADGNPSGPYTPGTTPGGNGNGPFTPGADGNPAGPHTPGTIEGPTSGGPFSGNNGGGFWGRVKSIGAGIWSGIRSVGRFLWTLGGLAPWAHMPAVGTLPMGGVGTNVSRNENTVPPINDGRINDGSLRPDDLRPGRPGVAGNGATSSTNTRPTHGFFVP